MKTLSAALLCTLLLAACGAVPSGASDGGPDTDAGVATEAPPDPGSGGTPGVGLPGGGAPDAGLPDAGSPPARLRVMGTVVSTARQPLAGLHVQVAGQAPVSTDGAGRFSLADVTPPYALTVVDAARREAIVYRGLRREDPTLVLFTPPPGARRAQVQGRVHGGHVPQGSDELTALVLLAPGTAALSVADAAGDFLFGPETLGWDGPEALAGTLHALQLRYAPATGLPSSFSGYARRALTLADGAALGAQDLVLAPIGSGTVSGSVTAPAGYALQDKGVGTLLDGTPALYFPDRSTDAAFAYVVPVLPGARVLLSASVGRAGGGASGHVRTDLAPGAAQVPLSPQPPPEALLPADGAAQVDAQTRFSWTPFARGISLVVFEPLSTGAPRLTVVTEEAHAELPAPSALGLPFPRGAQYAWHVQALGPLAGADAAASPALLDTLTLAPGVAERHLARSAERRFSTAP